MTKEEMMAKVDAMKEKAMSRALSDSDLDAINGGAANTDAGPMFQVGDLVYAKEMEELGRCTIEQVTEFYGLYFYDVRFPNGLGMSIPEDDLYY